MNKAKWELALLALLLVFLFGSSSTTGGKWAQQILLEPNVKGATNAPDSKTLVETVVDGLIP